MNDENLSSAKVGMKIAIFTLENTTTSQLEVFVKHFETSPSFLEEYLSHVYNPNVINENDGFLKDKFHSFFRNIFPKDMTRKEIIISGQFSCKFHHQGHQMAVLVLTFIVSRSRLSPNTEILKIHTWSKIPRPKTGKDVKNRL